MEQALIAEGVPVEQVQKVCDVHVQVFEQALERQKKTKVLPGHPVHTYLEENKALRRILRRLRPLLRQVPRGAAQGGFRKGAGGAESYRDPLPAQGEPALPLSRAGAVHRTFQGDVGQARRDPQPAAGVRSRLPRGGLGPFQAAGGGLLRAIRRMIFMEEKILFPTSLKKLSERQWAEIRRGEGEIGYAWIQPGNLWDPSVVIAASVAKDLGKAPERHGGCAAEAAATAKESAAGEIALDVGALTPRADQPDVEEPSPRCDLRGRERQGALLLPGQGADLSPQPGGDRAGGAELPSPDSVHVVEKILESFKQKEKDQAEFWLTLKDRFIHIRYFALYDREGAYRGVMEVSQDVTEIRALKGQRRLLDWYTPLTREDPEPR